MSDAGTPPTPAPGAGRLMSLDVFRGITIAAMMLVNNPGSWKAGERFPPLDHAEWHGWTFTDIIFPFFLWIVGVAIPLSIARRLEQGQSRQELFGHAVRRAAIIFGLGLFLASFGFFFNGIKQALDPLAAEQGASFSGWLQSFLTTVRIPGVLQRIAVCYLCATAIYLWADRYRQISITVGLLVAYWLVMALAPYAIEVNGQMHYGSGSLKAGENFSAYVDNLVLNGPQIGTHVYGENKTWDPEGIVSTLPAIASVMLGIFAGQLLRSPRSAAEKTAWLMVGGAILMWVGELMNLGLPINKKIWTSSYTVFMGGLAMVVFGVCYWLVDVQGWRRVSKPFAVYGMNAIAVFVLSGVLGRLFNEIKIRVPKGEPVALKTWLYEKLFVHNWTFPKGSWLEWATPKGWSLDWAIVWVLLLFLVAWGMYRKKWFVKF